MEQQNDTLSITLRFGIWTLPIVIRREDEYAYRQAEVLIKERYSYYTSNFKNQTTEMYLVMTMLDIAVQMKQKEINFDLTPVTKRLEPLLAELESALKTES